MNQSPSFEDIFSLIEKTVSLLMASGSHTPRVIKNVERIANLFGCQAIVLLTVKAVSVTLKKGKLYKSFSFPVSLSGVNYETLFLVNQLTWKACEKKIGVQELEEKLTKIAKLKRYSFASTLLAVSLADAAFCQLFGGDYWSMGFSFIGTSAGFTVRHITKKAGTNPFVSTMLSALAASFTAGLLCLTVPGSFHLATATSVLFLIPGVVIIGATIDLMEGYMEAGLGRSMFATGILASIAVGLLPALTLLGRHIWAY
ncbi:MAG: threonine/serine exporter family protein [Cytophagales bacterium]|nr:threonine/serine exporter family protein [Cytophagales bacterium]